MSTFFLPSDLMKVYFHVAFNVHLAPICSLSALSWCEPCSSDWASEQTSKREYELSNKSMYMYDCVWLCANYGLFIGSFPFGWARGWREKIYCYSMIWKWILVGSDLYESKQISAWNILLVSSYFWSEIERARNAIKVRPLSQLNCGHHL